MRRIAVVSLLVLYASTLAHGETTPLTTELKGESVTEITVECDGPPSQPVGPKDVPIAPPRGTYHYNLYLPPGYGDDPKEEYPVLFIMFMPARGKAGIFADRLAKDRFIGVFLLDTSTVPHDGLNFAGFYAAHDDVIKRVRVAQDFKFITGYSGASRDAANCIISRPGFAGIALQGNGFYGTDATSARTNPRLGVFMGFGRDDVNKRDIAENLKTIPAGNGFMYQLYRGGHVQYPAEMADPVMDFFEQWAFRDAPATKTGSAIYTKVWNQMIAKIDPAGADFATADAVDEAVEYAQSHGLDKDKELATKFNELKKKQTILSRLATYKKETAARADYRKVFASEKQIYRASNGDESKLQDLMRQASKAYEGVAAKNPGMLYATRATERAKELVDKASAITAARTPTTAAVRGG